MKPPVELPLEMILMILSFLDTPTLHMLIKKWPRDIGRLLRTGHTWFVLSCKGLVYAHDIHQVLAVVPHNRILAIIARNFISVDNSFCNLWKLHLPRTHLPLLPSIRDVLWINEVGRRQTVDRASVVGIMSAARVYGNLITAPDAVRVDIWGGDDVTIDGKLFPRAKTIHVRPIPRSAERTERCYVNVFQAPCLEHLIVDTDARCVDAAGGNCPCLKKVTVSGQGVRGMSSRDRGSVSHLSVVLQ